MDTQFTSIRVLRDTAQKAKVIATLEAMTREAWIEWMVNKAYESMIINKGRKQK